MKLCRPGRESHTNITRDIAVESRKDEVAVSKLLGLAVTEDKVAKPLRHSGSLLPSHGILVALSRRTFRRTNGVKLQEGVVCEQ